MAYTKIDHSRADFIGIVASNIIKIQRYPCLIISRLKRHLGKSGTLFFDDSEFYDAIKYLLEQGAIVYANESQETIKTENFPLLVYIASGHFKIVESN